jgi:hypothetical protein
MQQILRVPPASGDGYEHIILAFMIYYDRVRTRPVRNAVVELLIVISVIDIDWITIGLDSGIRLCNSHERGQQDREQ